MRKVLILGLALSLIAAGLMPVSACALISAQKAECAEATNQPPCEQMNHPDGGAQFSKGSNKSCCAVSQAPAPELQYKVAEVGLAARISVTGSRLAVPGIMPSTTLLVVEDSSPPSLQSLLCTYLI